MSERLVNIQVWLPEGMDIAQVSAVHPNDRGYPYYLKIKTCYPVEKSQMTREKAIKVALKFNLLERHVGYLEALGLIKFEEEVSIKSPSLVIQDTVNGLMSSYVKLTDADKVVNALMEAGYKIIRK